MRKLYSVGLLFAAVLLQVAKANYDLEVRFHSYSNPSNHDFRGNRCDGFYSLGCSVIYFLCVRSYQYSPPRSDADCTLGSQGTIGSPYNINGQYTFSGTTFPGDSGLSNPVVFSGDSWPGRFQMMVRLADHDFNSPDLIDRVIVDKILGVSTSFTSVARHSGYYSSASLQLSFRVQCSQDFYGSDCTIFCQPQASDTLGHFTCDANGNRVCMTGYNPPDCITPICSEFCQGSCSAPNLCDQCFDGFSGEFCDQCELANGCNAGNAYCRNPYDCICLNGYGGTLCNMDLDVCGHQSPCRNGATCANLGPDQYSCDCPPGYTGRNCDMDVDYCLSSPCMNGATCMSLGPEQQFNCTCPVRWTGPLCGENIDECTVSPPCVNGGVCSDCTPTSSQPFVSPSSPSTATFPFCPLGYNCTCPEGYFGNRCETEVDYCQPSPCLNDGFCVDINGGPGYTCTCTTGYSGTNCETEVDLCDSSPCLNGATCSSSLGSYNCTCAPGYTGSNCATDIDECSSSPCAANASLECMDGTNSFTCTCLPGFTGTDCSMMVDLCDVFGCSNGGTCTSLVNDFQCKCPEGFNGTRCENTITHCTPNPCLFGGTCMNQASSYVCQCPPTFSGSRCEEQVDLCMFLDCGENSFCQQVPQLDLGYQCLPCVNGQASCGLASQSGKNGTQNQAKSQGALIGGVVGGVVAAVSLLFCLIAAIFLCVRGRPRVVKEETAVVDESVKTQSNPMYFEASTILASNSYKHPSVKSSQKHDTTSGYVSLDNVINGSNPRVSQAPPLQQPPPSMYNTFDHQDDQHHYEHIPGQYAAIEPRGGPPELPPDRNSGNAHHYNHIQRQEKVPIAQSGKYDMLEKEMKPMQTGKIDKNPENDTTAQPPSSTPYSSKFNPYVLEPSSN